MNRIKLNQDIKPLSDFRANAAAAINHVQETKRAMVITKRGYSAAVVLDVATYESMVEELDRLSNLQAAS
ncbi:MAG: type II toxin-antitoxin system Phd/YefM family antitoxin [Acidobacteriota bacterium]|nr:type II toxin-antitoxin system Phd/YefM family antitoxin [Acidobacteriota bacterium]